MRYLGMHTKSQAEWLAVINNSKYKDFEADCYNQGPLIEALETRVAGLIGKEAGMFFNKGTTCQLALMKTVCEAKGNSRVVLHPQCHIVYDEQDAYQALMGLEGVICGEVGQIMTTEDLSSVNTPVSLVVVELPLRRAGFKLTPWNELLKLRQWCDEHDVHLHMDGARLWESAPYYDKNFNEIVDIFDSVYVSFYKGIGGMSGAMLLGSESLLSSCALWRDRLGSNMWTTFPAVVTAMDGLDSRLPKIPTWVERAKQLEKLLKQFKTLDVDSPDCHAFQIRLKADLKEINQALIWCQERYQMVVCKPFENTPCGQFVFSEVQVGAKHDDISDTELELFFAALLSGMASDAIDFGA